MKRVLKHNKTICFMCLQLSRGGTERVVSILGNYFCNHGYDSTIIVLENAPIDYYIDPRINVVCLNIKKGEFIKGLAGSACKVWKILNKQDITVVMNNRPIIVGTVCSILTKTKLIYAERNDPSRVPESRIGRLVRDICFKKADFYVFQTHDQMGYFGKKARREGLVILNPISDDLPIHDVNDCDDVIISACRYDKQKNLRMAIDAFYIFWKNHKNYNFYVYGKGPEKEELEKYINSKGMEDVIFLKDFTNDIHDKMARATVFVLSSDFEGISNSMIEAMGIGLPVVCTDCPVGGARELIEDGVNGMLVKVGDVNTMAQRISDVVDDKELQYALGSNARLVSEKLSQDKICDEWMSAVNHLIDGI